MEDVKQEVGIKESMEMLEGLKVLLVAGKKISADGKVSFDDMPVVLGLLKDVGVISAAVQGSDQIKVEAKDLSAEELQELGKKVLEVIAAVKAS